MPLCRDARAQMAPKKQFRAELFFYITMHTSLFYLTPKLLQRDLYTHVRRSLILLYEVVVLRCAPHKPMTLLPTVLGRQQRHRRYVSTNASSSTYKHRHG